MRNSRPRRRQNFALKHIKIVVKHSSGKILVSFRLRSYATNTTDTDGCECDFSWSATTLGRFLWRRRRLPRGRNKTEGTEIRSSYYYAKIRIARNELSSAAFT
jgi:hypothetical protein